MSQYQQESARHVTCKQSMRCGLFLQMSHPASYWSNILPHLYLAPPSGVMLLKFRRDLWYQKTRVPVLSYGVVCVILHLAVLVQCRLVTDTRTDGWTQGDSIYRAIMTSRGKISAQFIRKGLTPWSLCLCVETWVSRAKKQVNRSRCRLEC